jgi:hypothetical protein
MSGPFVPTDEQHAEASVSVLVSLEEIFENHVEVFHFRSKRSAHDIGDTVLLSAMASSWEANSGFSYNASFTPTMDGVFASLSAAWTLNRKRRTEDRHFVIPYFEDISGKTGRFSYSFEWSEGATGKRRPEKGDRKKGSIRKSQKPLDSAGHRESQHPVETLRSGPQPGKDRPLRGHEQLKSGPKAATTRSKRSEWPVQKQTLHALTPNRVPRQKSRSQPSRRNDRFKTSTTTPFPTVSLGRFTNGVVN